MKELNIICDIAGQYRTLLALVAEMPPCSVLAVGDLMDRGPDSKSVMDFFMETENADSLFGNHEHLMLMELQRKPFYDECFWPLANGGMQTLLSFASPSMHDDIYKLYTEVAQSGYLSSDGVISMRAFIRDSVPQKYIDWLAKRPYYKQFPGLFVSHAAMPRHRTLEQAMDWGKRVSDSLYTDHISWNRGHPHSAGTFQVFGHIRGFKEYSRQHKLGRKIDKPTVVSDDAYAVCIDTSRKGVMTGMHWPSKQIYQVEHLE